MSSTFYPTHYSLEWMFNWRPPKIQIGYYLCIGKQNITKGRVRNF
jgi:hypothetical protein